MSQHYGSSESNDEFEYESEEESSPQDLFFDALDESASDGGNDIVEGLRKLVQIRRHEAEAPVLEDFRQIVRIVSPDWLRKTMTATQWEAMTEELAISLFDNPDWHDRLVQFWRRLLAETT